MFRKKAVRIVIDVRFQYFDSCDFRLENFHRYSSPTDLKKRSAPVGYAAEYLMTIGLWHNLPLKLPLLYHFSHLS